MSTSRRPSVLLVDDGSLNRFIIEQLFDQELEGLHFASTEIEAVDIVVREQPTIILVNAESSALQTTLLADILRAHHRSCFETIIALGEPRQTGASLAPDPDTYDMILSQPLDFSMLRDLIRMLVGPE